MLLLIDGNNLAWAGYYGLERAMKPDSDERRARVALLGLSSMVLGVIARDGEPPSAGPSPAAVRRAASKQSSMSFDDDGNSAGEADGAGATGRSGASGAGDGAGVSGRSGTGAGVSPGARSASAKTAVTRVVIAFDEGRPLRRRETYPSYQTGREGDPKFMENEPTILGAVAAFCAIAEKALPVEVLRGNNTEADDLIAGMVQRETKIRKRIVSTDRDFLQLIGPMTDVYAPVKKLVISEANFDEVAAPSTSSGAAIAFPRERYLDYRALTGDPSDNLPGLTGMGPLSAAKLLRLAPLDDYFGNPDAVRAALERKSVAVEEAFANGTAREIVERNRMLMDLRRPAPCWDELDALTTRGTWRRERFEAWYREEKISAVEEGPLFARLESLAVGR